MAIDNPTALLKKTTESVPGTAIASLGLALCLYVYETRRMSSFQNVETGSFASSLPGILALAALVILLLVYRSHPKFRLHRHPLVGFAIAGAIAISMVLAYGAGLWPESDALAFAAKAVTRVCEILLMACWAEILIPLGARNAAVLFAISLFYLGCFNALSALFKENVVYTLVAMVPLLSVACLYWFRDRSSSFDVYSPDKRTDAFAMFSVDRSLMPPSTSKLSIASIVLVFLLPLICYSFVFGHIHFSWIPNQDGSLTSLSIQLGAAVGTIAAGFVMLFLVTYFWGRRKLELYNLFMLPVLLLALYLTGLLSGELSFLYVVPLNVAQKVAFFFIWMAPFLVPTVSSPLASWCIALGLYQTGKVLSTTASEVPDPLFYALWVVAFVSVLIAGSVVGVLLGGKNANEAPTPPESPASDGSGAPQESGHEPEALLEPSDEETHTTALICNDIAREYQLTRREEEILQLLAEGMTAQLIAETLVVSTSTAKSHMRNIYAKLGIHAQSEILLMIHRRTG